MRKRESELTKSLGLHKATWKDRARELHAKGLSSATIAERLGKSKPAIYKAISAPSSTDRISGFEPEDEGSNPSERAK